jgi:hypothetical protein
LRLPDLAEQTGMTKSNMQRTLQNTSDFAFTFSFGSDMKKSAASR